MQESAALRGPPKVKNKAPSAIQISAEQLLREAVDRQEPGLQAPTQRFADLEELHEFQGRKRKEFEDYVRRNRINMNVSCSIPSKAIRMPANRTRTGCDMRSGS